MCATPESDFLRFFLSSFFFSSGNFFAATSSIRFVLLNHLIRTHPSRWASPEVLLTQYSFLPSPTLIPSRCQTVCPSVFPGDRFLASIGRLLDIQFFFLYVTRQLAENSNCFSKILSRPNSGKTLLEQSEVRTIFGYHSASDPKPYDSRGNSPGFVHYAEILSVRDDILQNVK